ncbi:MAG: right-handed parallel beta-helix repeat-containing protein, partial [Anaerolineae bacterium]|nr:right-handed parallel beta-helix repeat-containing protein [Anaerolineae bacterium]
MSPNRRLDLVRLGRLGIVAALSLLGLVGLGLVAATSARAAPTAAPALQQGCTTLWSGNVTTHTTWTTAGSPYCIQSGFAVNAGIALTISPGVEVRFAADTHLQVYGSLLAEGTAGQPVAFTTQEATPAAGSWRYLAAQPGSHVRMSHCDMGYAGSVYNGGLWIRSSDVEVRNCRIHDTSGDGVIVEGTGLTPLLQDTQVEDNSGSAVRQTTIDMAPRYANLTLAGNGVNALVIPDGTIARDLTMDGPGGFNGLPIRVGNVYIGTGYALTVTAGTTLQFGGDTQLQVRGGASLIAEGTAAQPIAFTTQSTTPVADAWRYLYAVPGSRVRLRHCDVGYAGSIYNGGLWIASSDVEVRDCRVHDTGGDGVVVEGT